jgi:putative intracellular protease/amidase
MNKVGSETVHVGVYEAWADWEAGYAVAHLGSGDWQSQGKRYRIVLVGETEEPITTKGGLRLTPDVTAAEVNPRESAMLILPGADSWLAGRNGAFVELAGRFLEAGVPVAAICGATVGLAQAGLLNERPHTSNAPQLLEGPAYRGQDHYRYEAAVTDGNLITATGIAPVEFAQAIFDRLGFYDRATSDNWYLLYGKHDPAGYFGLIAASNAV